jgi:hypothetical protein
MAELTRVQIDAANARGREIAATLPHAAKARYDRRSRRIVVELTNGSLFAFPAELAQGLAGASADQLSEIELSGGGYGLHWPQLDADLTVPGLLAGIFGTARWMAAQAGRASSPAKAAAARRNGAKGGRPHKAVA